MAKAVYPGVIYSFRVYPEGESQWYTVHVWSTRRLMREHIKAAHPALNVSQVIACVLWPVRRRPRNLGEIHFNQRDLGQDTISHEASHAALEWARRQGLDVDNPVDPEAANADEERFCDALGAIAHQIGESLRTYNLL